jgi:hypothetical protein
LGEGDPGMVGTIIGDDGIGISVVSFLHIIENVYILSGNACNGKNSSTHKALYNPLSLNCHVQLRAIIARILSGCKIFAKHHRLEHLF